MFLIDIIYNQLREQVNPLEHWEDLNMTTKDLKVLQKNEAVKRLKSFLKLDKTVIDEFIHSNIVYCSKRLNKLFDGILDFNNNNESFKKVVEEFEQEKNALVYHTQLTYTEFGTCLSLFYVSEDVEEWELDRNDLTPDARGLMYPFVYVVNLSEPEYSEFGQIGIVRKNGGVSRVY